MAANRPVRYVFLDTETTGLVPPIGVVEVAYAVIDADFNIEFSYDSLVNPGLPIDPGASNVHGIVDADVQDAISLSEALKPIADEPCILIGHNVQFDYKLVADVLKVEDQVCTLALSRQYIHDAPNHKLGTLQQHLGFPDFTAHRALGDVMTALELLKHILRKYNLSLQQVTQRQRAPRMLLHMPFGKYEGRLVTEVPASYRQWLLSTGNLDKDLQYTLEKLVHI